MTTFKTLLQREWMQHHIGWWVLVLAPLVLMVVAAIFGQVQVSGHEANDTPAGLGLLLAGGYATFMAAITWLIIGLQAPGLARRDVQDRSIEFWRSLPVNDALAVASTLLAHLVLVPLAVMAAALLSGSLVGLMVVARGFGWSALAGLPWHELGPIWLAAVPRLLVGSLLASLWAAPIVLAAMAASAWLKRWGVPVLLVVVGLGGVLLKQVYDMPWLLDTVARLWLRAANALMPLHADALEGAPLTDLPRLILQDLGRQLQDLASPLLGVALVVSAACFALMVLRRQRS
jgi:ABC-2 type transport system permease protein